MEEDRGRRIEDGRTEKTEEWKGIPFSDVKGKFKKEDSYTTAAHFNNNKVYFFDVVRDQVPPSHKLYEFDLTTEILRDLTVDYSDLPPANSDGIFSNSSSLFWTSLKQKNQVFQYDLSSGRLSSLEVVESLGRPLRPREVSLNVQFDVTEDYLFYQSSSYLKIVSLSEHAMQTVPLYPETDERLPRVLLFTDGFNLLYNVTDETFDSRGDFVLELDCEI